MTPDESEALARLQGRPVLSEKSRQWINDIVADAPPLTPDQRACIAAAFRSGRRLGRLVKSERAA